MGRKSNITHFEDCPVPTSEDSSVYKILSFKFPERAKSIAARWELYTGTTLDVENVTLFNIARFKERCYEDISPNSVATTCAWLASVVRIALTDSGINPQKFCEALLCKRESGTFAWVNQAEIDKIVKYYESCTDVQLRAVAALAILEFYTAARKSDTSDFTSANVKSQAYIDKETKQTRQIDMICYTSKKTSIKASIPVKPIVKKILDDELIRSVKISNTKFNFVIKHIAEEIGLDRLVTEHKHGVDIKDVPLYKCLSSHSFRRSFATVLQRDGVSIELVAKMMGHTNHTQTRRYVQSDTLVMEDEVLNFFK